MGCKTLTGNVTGFSCVGLFVRYRDVYWKDNGKAAIFIIAK